MSGFEDVEDRIIKEYISDIELSRSLVSIREVMEFIWGKAPLIMQYYTDHGVEHSVRVAEFVENLLNIGKNAKFSQQEIYLLLAGVYLHDIGMQCDINNHLEVKNKAEKLGADFKEEYSPIAKICYEEKQLAEIRENHHYLSAAYIDYLCRGNDQVLSPRIMKLPRYFINDLMDVCMFHSKMQIDGCDYSFKHYPNSRKRMVAALLRLADELDITRDRATKETAQISPMDPDTEMYYWLHDHTRVNFIDSKKIRLTVMLHPNDCEQIGSLLREEYVLQFKRKNQSLIEELHEHEIFVLFDKKSNVKTDEYLDEFPLKIRNAVINKFGKKLSSSKRDISSSEADLSEVINADINESTDKIVSLETEISHSEAVLSEVINADINESTDKIVSLETEISHSEADLSEVINADINESTDKIVSLETEISHSENYNTYNRNSIEKYIGEGFLKSEDRTELLCKFETWQSEDGEITLICDCSIYNLDLPKYYPELNFDNSLSPVEVKFFIAWSRYSPTNIFQQLNKFRIFSGVTYDGWNITGEIGMYVNTDPESLSDDTPRIKFEYYVKELTVNRDSKEDLQCVRFGVTNFNFTGNESRGNILTLELKGAKRLTIEKKNEYESAIDYLENFKGVRVTSEISVEIDNDAEIKKSEDIANDLCELMSIACGTRAIWIYCYGYNTEGEIVSRFHRSSVTRPYQPMQLIRKDYIWLKSFLEDSYAVYVDKPELLKSNKYIINTYLDGKKQNDYLEQRGIKIVVVIGLFTELLLSLKTEIEHITDEKELKTLKSELEKAFKEVLEQNVDPNSRDKIYQNIFGCISEINRTPFNELLSDFCEYIGLKEDNLQSIIDSRNKLIHKGKFICQTYKDKNNLVQEYPNFKDPWSEYSYSLNFVDKCILKLLGYKGYYINQNNFKEEELL